MPYLNDERKAILDLDPMQAKDAGDYNYLYTISYLKEFIKEPRYKTIAKINSGWLPLIMAVSDTLSHLGLTSTEQGEVRRIAFLEFYHRIGRLYEDYAIEKNGDVKEFAEAEEVVNDLLDVHLSSL
jgi:hypothetical protein